MKRLIFIAFFFISISSFAQNSIKTKLDRIIKKDYTIIEGTISKMSDEEVEYSLPNEKMVNILKVSKIARIEFANGRTQSFDVSAQETTNSVDTTIQTTGYQEQVIKPNTIAVLPIPFVNSDNLSTSEEMAKFAQNDMYSKLIEKSANIYPLVVQDIRDTNRLLRKAGIDYKNVDEVPITDLQKILGVDNIIAARVSYTVDINQTTTGIKSTEIATKGNKTSIDDFDMSDTTIDKTFNYNVYFDLYKNNIKTYTQTRQPFFNMKDSWMDSMSYLLKRSPIYTKK